MLGQGAATPVAAEGIAAALSSAVGSSPLLVQFDKALPLALLDAQLAQVVAAITAAGHADTTIVLTGASTNAVKAQERRAVFADPRSSLLVFFSPLLLFFFKKTSYILQLRRRPRAPAARPRCTSM